MSVNSGQIEFRNVSFSYPGSSQMILKNINLTIHPGETVAIMGATGCGKSTLIHLIPRFYDVTEGAVLVDGVDVRDYNQKALHEKIAISLQKSELFHQTMVAERGTSLSGGQKQRVSIARAVVKNAPILIFDDSTSALDLKTEADLYAALKQSCPNSTKIMVAQRIASVRHADRIVVLENGSIAACGSHEELLECCKSYRDIYDSQMGKEEHH